MCIDDYLIKFNEKRKAIHKKIAMWLSNFFVNDTF